MQTPFPGMDPYLEHPALWPDVHNSLIAAIRDALSPAVAPDYYVALERRAYLLRPDDIVFVGRPDVSVITHRLPSLPKTAPEFTGVMEVEVPMNDKVEESFLEIHEVRTGALVTLMELLSPVNKVHPEGRAQYEQKREQVLHTRTNLVEIDLLRVGEPMAVYGRGARSDYRILISRSTQRPRAQLYAFSVRQPIPSFPLPLLPQDEEPMVELNTIVHDLYTRARFDLRLDYTQPPAPPLSDDDAEWAAALLAD